MFFKQKQRFSIRKYSFGAASVLLGTVILGMAAPEASADTAQPETQQVLKEENTSVQTSDLSSPEMEAVSETPEIQSQEKLVQSTDTPIAEPVVASENLDGAATSVHATRVPSTDIPVTELADPSESAEVPATQVQEAPAPLADSPVAEPVAASESPEGDETSPQEENYPAPSALISDTADKPRVRSARSLPDSPADEQNLLEDVQNTLVDKTDLKELIGESDAFKPTTSYTEGGKEERDAYDKAIAAGEAVFDDALAKQEAVDTAIRNIKETDTRLRLSAAAALVKAAEEADKAAQAKKQEVEQDATVDTDEAKAVDDLNKKTLGKITSARNVVDFLPEVAEKATLKDRLDKIKTSGVVVGIVGTAIARAELHTRLTEQAARAAAAKKREVETDGAVNSAEKVEVDALNDKVTNSKKLAEQFVDNLPESREKTEFKDRLSKATTSEVVINDFDKDGKADKQDILKDAEAAVQAADDVAQIAKSKKAEVESDGHVKQEEKTTIDDLNEAITANKESATSKVNNLPDSPDKVALKKWLDKITTSEVTVGTADNKVKSDKPDTAIARADFYTTSTESKAKAAAAKKKEVEADGAVNPAEKLEVDALNDKVTNSKKLAEQFVDTLPEGEEKKEFKDRLSKVTTSGVKINDADSNGKSDELDDKITGFDNVIKAGEQSVQAAKTKKAEVEKDGFVTAEEKQAVDSLNAGITKIKEILKNFIDTLPEIPEKKEFKARFDKLTTSDVTVGAVDNSKDKADSQEEQGIVPVTADDSKDKPDSKVEQADAPVAAEDTADSKDKVNNPEQSDANLSSAELAVKTAEDAAEVAKNKKAEVEADGIVTPTEKADADQFNPIVTSSKKHAQSLVDNLPDSDTKKALQDRLDKVTTSEVLINDFDSNGKADIQDRLEAAEALVKAAEEAAKAGQDKKATIEADGAVNPAEKKAVDELNNRTVDARDHAAGFVGQLPDGKAKTDLQERLAKVTTSVVTVNDADSNGKVDAEEAAALRTTKDLLTSAEQVVQKAQAKKIEVESDGVVTEAEKAEVDKLNTQITDSKKHLSSALDNLSGTEIPALRERLEKLTTSEVTVGYTESKIKSDKLKNAIARADFFTTSTEKAAQIAAAKKQEVEADGVVNPAEKQEVDALNAEVTKSKKLAEQLIDTLPENSETKELKDRLAKVTTADVTVNDADNDGKVDSKDEQADTPVAAADSDGKADSKVEQTADNTGKFDIKDEQSTDNNDKTDSQTERDVAFIDAQEAVEDAEYPAQSGKDKKTEAEKDGVITPSEKEHLDRIDTIITAAKQHAQSLVDKLPDSDAKKALQERLAKITTSEVTVSDVNNDSKADNKEQQDIVPVVADDTTDSKDKADNKDEQVADNTGKADSKDEQADAPVAADDSDGKVDSKVEQSADNDGRVDNKDEQAADNTGKADSQAERDVALRHAQQAVEDAEDSAQFGKDNKAEAEKDGVITPSEKEHLDQIDTIITAAKQHAQSLVDKLPDSDAKKALQERLAKITTSQVTVNDADSNGKADDKERLEKAEAAVKSVEALAQSAKDKKKEVESDGVVNPAEKEEVDRLNEKVTVNKDFVTSLINDNLPDSPEKAAFMDRLAKITTSEVTVNDADSNGKADSQDKQEAALAAAEAAVKAAEDAAKAGQAKKAEVEQDRLVTPAEKTAVDNLNKATADKKTAATALVDKLPDGDSKTALKDRLGKVTPSQVTVNDADSNGKADSQDKQEAALATAEAAVKAAEDAAKAGQAKKAEVEQDGLVTPAEKQAVDSLNAEVTKSKQAAEKFVDTLPEGKEKNEFKARLAKVTTSKVTVNDADSNGKADNLDSIIARADFFTTSTERAAQAAKTKKAEVEKDGLVTPAEKQAVDSLNAEVTKSKQA
ncbi:GA-like domain-containing protein, partial [Streptococcus thoraltensis]